MAAVHGQTNETASSALERSQGQRIHAVFVPQPPLHPPDLLTLLPLPTTLLLYHTRTLCTMKSPPPVKNKKRKAEESDEEYDDEENDDEEPVDEEPVDKRTTAKQPPKKKGGERFYGTKEEKNRLKRRKEEMESFDWSKFAKSEKPTDIQAAKRDHLEVLRKQHGRDWKKCVPSANFTFPSIQEIHQNPLWYNNTKNLACLPIGALPRSLRSQVQIHREAERKKRKREEGTCCRLCTKKLIEREKSEVR